MKHNFMNHLTKVTATVIAVALISSPISAEAKTAIDTVGAVQAIAETANSIPSILYDDSTTVQNDFNNGTSVPILMDYAGNWIDQLGHKMSYTDSGRYLAEHQNYARVVCQINRELTDLNTDHRTNNLKAFANPETGFTTETYPFIQQTIDQFREDGTYIIMAMSPYNLQTVAAYRNWDKEVEFTDTIPICKSGKNGWLDQNCDTMTDLEVKEFFQANPEYQGAMTNFMEYANKQELDDGDIFTMASQLYCSWYMETVRYQRGITNGMFYSPSSAGLSDYILKDYWSLSILAEDFAKCADSLKYSYSLKFTDQAIEQLRESEIWCDACYIMFEANLNTLDMGAPELQGLDYVYCTKSGQLLNSRQETIGYIRRDDDVVYTSTIYCTDWHVCGYVNNDVLGGTYCHAGSFYKAVLEARLALAEE